MAKCSGCGKQVSEEDPYGFTPEGEYFCLRCRMARTVTKSFVFNSRLDKRKVFRERKRY